MAIITCDSCAPGIVNDDWTHLDYHYQGEEADEKHASITATLEVLGWLTYEGEADEPGYFTCPVCNEIQCGGGHRFLTQTQGA